MGVLISGVSNFKSVLIRVIPVYICSFSSFRSDEFDWLRQREKEAADQCCCHGDVGRVEEEIVRHQVPLSSTN